MMTAAPRLSIVILILTTWALPTSALADEVPVVAPEVEIKRLFREVQQALQSRGYDVGPIDGMPGPKTNAAIRQFEAENGLGSDIIATAEALGVTPRKACFWIDRQLNCPPGCSIGIAGTRDSVPGYFVDCPGYDTTLVPFP